MDDFAARFPTTSARELAARFQVSETTIGRWAHRRGLKKDAAYLAEIRQRGLLRAQRVTPRGPQHWKWKGGRAWERFKDPRYIAWRAQVLARDGYTCQQCGRRCKKYERGLAAHHVVAWAADPTRRYDVSNGMTLCRSCHMRLHGLGERIVPTVACACGCGTLISSEDPYGRPRRYVNHHAKRGPISPAARERMSVARRGKTLSAEHRRKISQGLRRSTKRIGRPRGTRSAAANAPAS